MSSSTTSDHSLDHFNSSTALMTRIAEALERLAPAKPLPVELATCGAWKWDGARYSFGQGLRSLPDVKHIPLDMLRGIELQKANLLANTLRFARGKPANNALLWGARGMGKSSLVKSVHAQCWAEGLPLILIEIDRDDISSLPDLLRCVANDGSRTLIYCDDLAFDEAEAHYKALKTMLEGGLEGRPQNVLLYATSNRRHIIARATIENEVDHALHQRDSVDDKVALADRFGLWLGFHACDQETYLEMIKAYAAFYKIQLENLERVALEWSITRGSRSGRVAWQFIQSCL
jgi:uncharacterized protein